MSRITVCTVAAFVGLAAVALPVLSQQDEANRTKAPPLSLDGLLNEKLPETSATDVKLTADNMACYVCHANMKTDRLVIVHGLNLDIGCVTCHGESTDHRNDENNITPPDTMYPRDEIDSNCIECHREHDVPPKDVLARWQERCPDTTNFKDIVCTDCHFHHRLKQRVVRWNKRTKELIVESAKSE